MPLSCSLGFDILESRIAPAITSSFTASTGLLAISSNASDSIALAVDPTTQKVLINGSPTLTVGGGSVLDSAVKQIHLTGGTGNNVFDLSQLTGTPLLNVSGFTVTGGGGSDTLVAPAGQANAWNITATNDGVLDRPTSATTGGITFSGIANLTGGTVSDTMIYANSSTDVSGTITEEGGSLTIEGANSGVGQALSFPGAINTNGGSLTINTPSFQALAPALPHTGTHSVTFTDSVNTGGGNFTIYADTIALVTTGGAVNLSTRDIAAGGNPQNTASIGNSGDMSFNAITITLGSATGSKGSANLFSQADSGYTAGSIELNAIMLAGAGNGNGFTFPVLPSVNISSASITLNNSMVMGGSVTFGADARSLHVSTAAPSNSASPITVSTAIDDLQTITLLAGVAVSTSSATLTLGPTSSIIATSFNGSASANSDSEVSPISVKIGVAVAVDSTSAIVNDQGSITTTGDTQLQSNAVNTLEAIANAGGSVNGTAGAALAVGVINSTSTVTVAANATLNVGGNLTQQANTVNNKAVSSSSATGDDGNVGLSGAVCYTKDVTTSQFLGKAMVGGSSIIQATETKGNVNGTKLLLIPVTFGGVGAASGVGTDDLGDLLSNMQGALTQKVFSGLESLTKEESNNQQQNGQQTQGEAPSFQAAASVAVDWEDNSATAFVAKGAVLEDAGSVTVDANINDVPGVSAAAATAKPESQTPSTPGTTSWSAAVAVAVGVYNNTATSYIDSGATVDAGGALSVTSEALNDYQVAYGINLYQAATLQPDYNTNAVTVNPGDIVQVDSGHVGGGTVGDWYQYIGSNAQDFNLISTDFTDTTLWKDLGTGGASLPTDITNQPGATSTLVNPGDIVQMANNNTSAGNVGDWYQYVGTAAATLDLTTTDFTNPNLWKDLGAGGSSLPTDQTDQIVTVNPGQKVEIGTNQTGAGTAGDWYQYIGAASRSFDLSTTNFNDSTQWQDLGAGWVVKTDNFIQTLTTYLNGDLGIGNNITTTWSDANAANESAEVGIAGSFTVLVMNQTSHASINSDAIVNQNTSPTYRTGQQDVVVMATGTNSSLNLGGNIQVPGLGGSSQSFQLSVVKPGAGSVATGSAVGAALVVIVYNDDDTATIASGAEVYGDSVDVDAETSVGNISALLSGASSGNSGFNGVFSVVTINNTTLAQIANGAIVTVGDADVVETFAPTPEGQAPALTQEMLEENAYPGTFTSDPHGDTIDTLPASLVVQAHDGTDDFNFAGGILSAQNAGFGASVALDLVNRDTEAYIGDSASSTNSTMGSQTITSAGDVLVDAKNSGIMATLALAATKVSNAPPEPPNTSQAQTAPTPPSQPAASGGSYGIGISADVSYNDINATTMAYIRNVPISAPDVLVNANNDTLMVSAAGSAAIVTKPEGSSTGLAGSYSQSSIGGPTSAYIDDSNLNLTGNLSVDAKSSEFIVSASASGSVATNQQGVSVAGQVSRDDISTSTNASIINGSTVNAGNVDVDANDSEKIISVAGAVAYGGKAGIGAAISINNIPSGNPFGTPSATPTHYTYAHIDNSDVTASGVTNLSATSMELIGAITVAAGAAQSGMAAAFAFSMNTITPNTQAYVKGKKQQGVQGNGNVNVDADDTSTIEALAGGLALVTGGSPTARTGVGVGLSFAVNTITNAATEGYVQGTTVSLPSGDLTESATFTPTIDILAVGGGLANSGDNSGATAGAAGAVNTISGTVLATIDSSNVTAAGVAQNASANANIEALSIGISGTLAGGQGGGVALAGAGSGSGNTIDDSVEASIRNGSHVTTQATGQVTMNALDASHITAGAGAVAISIATGDSNASGAFGVSVAVNSIGSSASPDLVTAAIHDSTVSAGGGLVMDSTGKSSILSITVAGSAASGNQSVVAFAGAGAGSQNSIYEKVQAIIDTGSNVTSGSGEAIQLTAMDNSYINADAGGLSLAYKGGTDAGGAGSLGAAAAVNTINNTILASINGATVVSGGNLDLTATTLDANGNPGEKIFALALGIAGALSNGSEGVGIGLAGAGSGANNQIDNDVEASIRNTQAVSTQNGGNVQLTAEDGAEITAAAGAAAIAVSTGAGGGGSGAIGVAVAINDIGTTGNPYLVTAGIFDSKVNSAGQVDVTAGSVSSILAVTVAGGVAAGSSETGSVTFAGAGAGSQNSIVKNVQALINGGSVVSSGNGEAIALGATDNSSIEADAGGLSLGFAGGDDASGAGALGAAAAVNLISNNVIANIDDSTVTSAGNLILNAATSAPTLTFNPATTVDTTANTITFATDPHLQTGEALTYSSGGGTPIGGLTNDTTYYAIVNPDNPERIQLAANRADALAGTAIDLTSDGTGSDQSFSYTGERIYALTLGIAGALGGGGEGAGIGIAGAGSGSNNQVTNNVTASITNSNAGDSHPITTQGSGEVELSAQDGVDITAVAGAAALAFATGSGAGSAAFGVAVALNDIGTSTTPGTVTAEISNSQVNAGGGVALNAEATNSILSVTVAGSFSGSGSEAASVTFAGAGAGSQNSIYDSIQALINNGSVVTTNNAQSVGLVAMDNSSITADAGGLSLGVSSADGGGGSGALGAAAAVNSINNVINATIDSSKVTSAGDVTLTATTLDADGNAGEKINVLALGIAGALSSGGEGAGIGLAGAGSATDNVIDNTIEATIHDSNGSNAVNAPNGTVTLSATDGSAITAASGGIAVAIGSGQSGAGSGAVGISLATNDISNIILATIDDSVVNAQSVDVQAQSSATIDALTFGGAGAGSGSGGISGALAGAGAGSGSTIADTIEASIKDGSVVTTTTADGVTLNAEDSTSITVAAGGAALGVAIGGEGAASLSVGLSIVNNNIGDCVKAFIDNATVNTTTGGGAVDVSATSNASIHALSLGAAAAVSGSSSPDSIAAAGAGVGATADNNIHNTIEAYIQNGATVTAGGDVAVNADDDSTIDAQAVGAALAAAAGSISLSGAIGVVIASNSIANLVEAFIGEQDSTTDKTKVQSSGNVAVNASETGEIQVLAVAASFAASVGIGGGVSGAGASAGSITSSTVAAFIDGGATVHATGTGSVNVAAADSQTIKSNVGSGALSFGLVGASVGVSTINDSIGDHLNAYIGDATVTSDGGNVSVDANATVNVHDLGVSTSVSISIGGAGAGIQTTVTDQMETRSYIGAGANVSADSGGVSVTAESAPTISAESDGGVAGIAATGVTETTANLEGCTKAYIGEGATVNAGSGGITVSATEQTSGGDNVSTSTVMVDVSLVGVTDQNATSNVSDTVEAFLGPEAGTTPTDAQTTIVTTGALNVTATSSTTAKAQASGGSGGGITVGVSEIETNLDGSVNAYAGGVLSITAGNTTISAQSTDTGTATLPLNVGIAGASGVGANVDAENGRSVSAYVESNGDVTIHSGGNLSLSATSTETANGSANGGNGGLVSVAVMVVQANTTGNTEAYIGEGATVTAGSLSVTANSTKNASATTTVVSVSLLGGGAGASTTSQTSGTTEAYIGHESADVSTPVATTLTVADEIDVSATSVAAPSVSANVGAGGTIVGVAGATGEAKDVSTTLAYLGKDTTVTEAGSVTIAATGASNPNAKLTLGAGGALAGGGGSLTAESDGSTQAFVDDNNNVTSTGDVDVSATSGANPNVNLTVAAGGLIAAGVGLATSNDFHMTSAYIGNNTTINVTAGSLSVTAMGSDAASSLGLVATGGLGAGQQTDANTTVSPTVQAYIGQYDTITTSGDVTVTANSQHAEAHANAEAFGGGGVEVGLPDATANSNPNVYAYIDVQTTIQAGGNVSVLAEEQSAPTVTLNDDIQAVDTVHNTVTFPDHGLQTGDQVEYVAGSPAIKTPTGPLANDRILNVIAVDANTLQFGQTFNATQVDASNPLSTAQGVDPNQNVIAFGAPDMFETGDAVEYTAGSGNTPIGLTDGSIYYVRVITPSTIKLYATEAEATATPLTFNPTTSGVITGGNTINASNTFTAGEAVTYLGPPPISFQTNSLNVQVTSFDINGNATNAQADSSANDIYVGGAAWGELNSGDPVVYTTNGTPIDGLTPGTTYYVIKGGVGGVGGVGTVQLASSYANSQWNGITPPVPVAISAAGNADTTHDLTIPPIGGLTNGATYTIYNPTSSSFELEDANGDVMTLDPTVTAETHSFIQDGIALTPGTGTQQVVLALSGSSITSATTDELLATDGTSLRDINTPPGTGQTSALAEGGDGGGITIALPTANVTNGAIVEAHDAAKLINALGNVSIVSLSIGNSSANASNDGAGIININNCQATTSFTLANSQPAETAAYIGSGDPFNGGIDGTGTAVQAVGAFTLSATTEVKTNVGSNTDGGGFISSTQAHSTANVNNTTEADVGGAASVTARSVSIVSDNDQYNLNVHAHSTAYGFAGSRTAGTASNIQSASAQVNIGADANITGYEGVDVIAENTNINPQLSSSTGGFILFGSTHEPEDNNNSLSATINAATGSLVAAGVRPSDSPLTAASSVSLPYLALFVQATGASVNSSSQNNTVLWDGNVHILSGVDPRLVIGQDGTILVDHNVTVQDGSLSGPTLGVGDMITSNTAVLDDITTVNPGQAYFFGGNGVSNDSTPTFTFINTFPQVAITNESDKNLVIHKIDIAATVESPNTVEIATPNQNTGTIPFDFSIVQASQPTVLDIANTGTGGDITLTDVIDNPIGQTIISDPVGNIDSTGSPQAIITNTLDIQAEGNIGCAADRVNVQLVQSTDDITGALRLTSLTAAATTGNIYMDVTGRERSTTTTSRFTVYMDSVSAGGNVNLLLESSLIDTAAGGSIGGVTVDVINIASGNSNDDGTSPYQTNFHPDSGSADLFDPGIFTSSSSPIDSRYDFRHYASGSATNQPGLSAGGNIIVELDAADLTGPETDIIGNTDLTGATGYIDTTTNGYINYTEYGGTAMRIGSVSSTGSYVLLTNPDQSFAGQDIDVVQNNCNNGLISAFTTIVLNVGDNLTTYGNNSITGSMLTAGSCITINLDGYPSGTSVDPGVGSIVNISGLISSPLTHIYGGVDSDTVNFNYADGVNTQGTSVASLASLANAQVMVNEEGGSNNSLKVDDSGDSGTDSGFMTNNFIFGIGMGGLGICYTNSESLEIDLSQGGTTTKNQIGTNVLVTNFTVYSVLATTPTFIKGGAGNDIIYVGSTPSTAPPTCDNAAFPSNLPAADDGNLNTIQAMLTVDGNGGQDYLEANDHADADGPAATPTNSTAYGYDYIVTPTQLLNDPSTIATVPTPDTPPSRTFAGITYNNSSTAAANSVTLLGLVGTDRTNRYLVTPSTLTSYEINGELPNTANRQDKGDYLDLNTTQLGNVDARTLHIFTVPSTYNDPLGDQNYTDGDPTQGDDTTDGELASPQGNGYWSFTLNGITYAKPVYFLSIESFNHVAVVATVSVPAPNSNQVPIVTVRDAETGQIEYTVQPYASVFHGGVNVTVGDINGDGIPDLITAPEEGHAPIVEIFNGTPDVNAVYHATLLNSFNGYDPVGNNQSFLGGLSIAVGDVNHDGYNDLVVGFGPGTTPMIQVLKGGTLLSSQPTILGKPFLAFSSSYGESISNTFRGGVNVAVGDIQVDGFADIVAAPASNGPPIVNVFSGYNPGKTTYAFLRGFTAFNASNVPGGLTLAVGDIGGGVDNAPDGIPDIIVGSSPGSSPLVDVFSGATLFTEKTVTPLEQLTKFAPSLFKGQILVIAEPDDGGDAWTIHQAVIFAELLPAETSGEVATPIYVTLTGF